METRVTAVVAEQCHTRIHHRVVTHTVNKSALARASELLQPKQAAQPSVGYWPSLYFVAVLLLCDTRSWMEEHMRAVRATINSGENTCLAVQCFQREQLSHVDSTSQMMYKEDTTATHTHTHTNNF